VNLVCFIRDTYVEADKIIVTQNNLRINNILEEQADNIYYLADIMSLENLELANEACEVAMRYLFLPVVVGSLVAIKRDEK